MAAAGDERANLQPFANEQRAAALRTVHLVGGERQQIDAGLVHVDRHLAHGLGRVDVQQAAARVGDRGNLGQRLQDANLVVRGHHADERRVVADRAGKRVKVDPPVTVDRRDGDPPAARPSDAVRAR